jgi:hypothetical protein
MSVATGQANDVEALRLATMERLQRLDSLIVERARRWIEEPAIYFAPDVRDRELVGQIHAAKREFLKIEARYLSARGEYLMLGCHAGEHKYCKRRVERDGAILVCSCACHKTKEV